MSALARGPFSRCKGLGVQGMNGTVQNVLEQRLVDQLLPFDGWQTLEYIAHYNNKIVIAIDLHFDLTAGQRLFNQLGNFGGFHK
ncbi:hypothetical protein MBHK15_110748 [Marinobacter salarius]|nr:hypothetical protein MBHK15_110748 [Marinobacter salarius]